jgi:hypothetical protein
MSDKEKWKPMEDDRPRLEEDVSTSTEDTQHLERRRRLKVAALLFRIRIGFSADPGLAFYVNAELRIQFCIQCFDDKKSKIIHLKFFFSEITIKLSLGLHKGCPLSKLQEKPLAQIREHPALQNSKVSSVFSLFVGHFCPSETGSGSSRPKSIRIRNAGERLL